MKSTETTADIEVADAKKKRPWAQYAAGVLTAILILRLVSLYFNSTALFFDEAQYWLWGKEPDFGYFSKPPLLGWIIGVFTNICGSDSEYCVRLASPVFHTGTAIFVYLSASHLFDKRTGFWAAIIFATLPGITLSATLISTDVPLLFFWAGAFWMLLRFRQDASWFNAIMLGTFVGLGLMAKYAMAYFFLCVVIFAIFERSARNIIFTTRYLLSIVVALVILSPNLWWNYQHQFITAGHTSDNIGWQGGLHPVNALEFFASQFGVFGPILFAVYLLALPRFVYDGWDDKQKLLVIFSLPVLILVVFQALMSKAYANWAAVTYVGAAILVADILVNRINGFWNRLSLSIHTMIMGVLSVAVAFSAAGYLTLPNGSEPFERLHGWREIAAATRTQLDAGKYSAVIGNHRHLSAELVYYLKERPEKIFAFYQPDTATTPPNDHYELTRPYRGMPRGAILLVSSVKSTLKYQPYFETISAITTAEISSGKIHNLWFFKLDGYRQVKMDVRGLLNGALQ